MQKHNISLLYAEDDSSIRATYVPLLQKKVEKLYVATNGEEGLALYKEFKPDLILTDIKMPIMDGFEMIKAIKKEQVNIRCMIMSAYKKPEYFTESIEIGVKSFLIKPVETKKLMEQLDEQATIVLQKKEYSVEVQKRKGVEQKLIKLNNELESRVSKRTKALQKEVNERRVFEDMLRESEEKYRQIFENANDGIILTINGIVKFVNPKLYEITGFLPKESISKPFTDFIHPDDREFVLQNHIARLKGEKVPERYDIRAYDKQRNIKWFEIKSAIIQWEMQPAVLTFITDITERKQTSRQLRELNLHLEHRVQEEIKKIEAQQQLLIQKSRLESLGEMAAGIAHEVNQPLGGISLALDNILFKISEQNCSEDYIENKIKQSFEDIERIRTIIDHIRAFSRDQDLSDSHKLGINKVIVNALSMINRQYQQHQIRFEMQLSTEECFIFGNQYRLEQVILNLLSNAKYAVENKINNENKEKQKLIKMSTSHQEDKVIITIEDNGTGIEEKHLNNIFDPFFTTKENDQGTGLGLSISYGIIKEMNGDISVDTKKDEYTKMIISFPKYKHN